MENSNKFMLVVIYGGLLGAFIAFCFVAGPMMLDIEIKFDYRIIAIGCIAGQFLVLINQSENNNGIKLIRSIILFFAALILIIFLWLPNHLL